MNKPEILPELNLETLKEKANEFAMKGAIETIKEYYSGYNSPFRKAIEEELTKTRIGFGIDLPDIIALINESLSKEIDLIANTAISKTFVPLVQRFLVREEKEMKFSEILKEFIKNTGSKSNDDCSIEMNKNYSYGWYDIELCANERSYKLTLHEESRLRSESQEKQKYQFLSLPYDHNKYAPTMKLHVEGGVILEMPFTKDVLHDDFTSFIARLIIAQTKITIDYQDFSEEMFPEEECHC
jgi:hypothetical protein